MQERRIGGAGGGSDKGRRRGETAFAVSVAVVIGIGGISVNASASSGGSTSSSSSTGDRGPNSRNRVTVRVGNGDSDAAEARLVRRGFRISGRATDDADDCAEHSYGQVIAFLRNHPCVALHRAYLVVRGPRGDAVLVAASWVQMATESEAKALRELLDTNGTGNITELSRESAAYRKVRFTGDAYASRRNGIVVSNAQAQPVLGGKTGLVLTELATNIVD